MFVTSFIHWTLSEKILQKKKHEFLPELPEIWRESLKRLPLGGGIKFQATLKYADPA